MFYFSILPPILPLEFLLKNKKGFFYRSFVNLQTKETLFVQRSHVEVVVMFEIKIHRVGLAFGKGASAIARILFRVYVYFLDLMFYEAIEVSHQQQPQHCSIYCS